MTSSCKKRWLNVLCVGPKQWHLVDTSVWSRHNQIQAVAIVVTDINFLIQHLFRERLRVQQRWNQRGGENGSDWSEIDDDKQLRTMKQIHHGSSWGGFILRSSGGVCVRTFKCRITTCPTHKVKVYHWLAHVVLTPLLSAAEMHFHHLSEINVYI